MKRHPIDIVSVLSGLLFTVLGIAFALGEANRIDVDVRFVPAAVLIAVGAAGIIASFRRARPTRAEATAASGAASGKPSDATSTDAAAAPPER